MWSTGAVKCVPPSRKDPPSCAFTYTHARGRARAQRLPRLSLRYNSTHRANVNGDVSTGSTTETLYSAQSLSWEAQKRQALPYPSPPPPTPQVAPLVSSGPRLAECLTPTPPLDSLPSPPANAPVFPTATIPATTDVAPVPHPSPLPNRPTSPSHPLTPTQSKDKRGVPRHGIGRPHNSGHRPHLTGTEAVTITTTTTVDVNTRVHGAGVGLITCSRRTRRRQLWWLAASAAIRHGGGGDDA